MKNKKLGRAVRSGRVPWACVVALLAFVGNNQCPAADMVKPMGAWFSCYERFVLDDEFIWTTGAYIETHYYLIDLKRLPEYSAVLIGNGSGKKLSPEDDAVLERWVAEGGALILTGAEQSRFWGNNLPEWVAGKDAAYWWSDTSAECAIQQPDHPLVRGLQNLGTNTEWRIGTSIANFKQGTSLIGKDNLTMLWVNKHGKGMVIYVGESLVPHTWPASQEKGITLNLTPLMRQFLTNLVAYLKIPTRNQVIAEWAKSPAASRETPIAIWYRHVREEKPLGGKAHVPPYPASSEELKELRFDMGIGEINRRYFFVTALAAQPQMQIQATDLVSLLGRRIPAGQVRIFIQEKPLPDYQKASYWLVDPKYVEPFGSPAVSLVANETYTYWIILDSGEAAPGHYFGKLEFYNGDALVKAIPMHMKVWPLHQPGPEVLHFELEHFWFGMPGGYWIDDKNNNPALLRKYQQNLGRLGVDFGETWADVDKGYYLKFIRLREDGRLLLEVMEKEPERFLKDPLPSLSFSGLWDTWWANAIQAGMTHSSSSWSIDYDDVSISFARRIPKDDKIALGSPEHLRFLKWYRGEYRKYLGERGLVGAYVKIMDEFGPEEIPAYLRSAGPIRSAGFKTYTSVYNLLQDKAAIAKMDHQTDMWLIAWPLENLHDFFKKHDIPFDPANEVWTTTSSSYWGSFIEYPRGYGWATARLRAEGLHTHGYLRWLWNETAGVFVGPDGPFDSTGVTSYGQTITEGRYLAQLYRMIDLAKKTGQGTKEAARIEGEIGEKIIGVPAGQGTGPLIPLKTEDTVLAGIKTQNALPDGYLSAETCNEAKLRVFEMMLRLKKAMGSVRPSVTYDNLRLVEDGRVTCQIVYGSDAAAAGPLVDHVVKLAGVKVPASAGIDSKANDQPKLLVLVGTLKDNPMLAAVVRKELPTEITPFYPPAGCYAFRRLTASGDHPAVLLVVGGDTAGLQIGVVNLCRLLTVENHW